MRGPSASSAAREARANKRGEGKLGKPVWKLTSVHRELPDGRTILDNVDLVVQEGAKIGVLGVNGCGKSSFLRVLAGVDDDYEGDVWLRPELRVGYLPQEPALDPSKTVLENVIEGLPIELQRALKEAVDDSNAASDSDAADDDEQDASPASPSSSPSDKETKRLQSFLLRALDALHCPPPHSPVTKLSGGEQRRVALCRLLVSSPDVLLLDEPTNHLDADSVAWLEHFLAKFNGTVLAVTHDRYFLDNVAGWILEVDRGNLYGYRGNYTFWLGEKQKRIQLEQRTSATINKRIARELEWINTTAPARQAKNRSRVKAYDQLLTTARTVPPEAGDIVIPPGPRLGNIVLEAINLSHAWEDGRILFSNLNFKIEPGSIVGIIGPNGSGKSVLFRLLTGQLKPSGGQIKVGQTVAMGFVSQSRAELDSDLTVFDAISEGQEEIDMGNYMLHMRKYVAAFHFRGTDQQRPVSTLSGGERNRVHVARSLKKNSNLILLDEPTNDLDIEVLQNLENALSTFAGTAVVISHDRWFLNRLCTHIVAFDGHGAVTFFSGTFAEYEEKLRQQGQSLKVNARGARKKIGNF